MRVKTAAVTKARHKKILKQAKGFFGSRHRLYKTAKESVMHSGKYAYRDRRQNKRNFRKLWITRINAACRENGISYSKFINGLNKAGIIINRKMLSEMAIESPEEFAKIVQTSKDALEGKTIKVESKKATSTKASSKKEEVKKETTKPKKETNAKKETSTKKVEKKESKKDLSKLTVAELKEEAKKKKINGYSTMKKAELLEALK